MGVVKRVVRVEQPDHHEPHGDQRQPDRLLLKEGTQEGQHRTAAEEAEQHTHMDQPPCRGRPIPFPDHLCQGDPHLPDMVGAEGGGHRDALRLPKGVVLHGGDEVDGHLNDLVGQAQGHPAHRKEHHELKQDQAGVPPQEPQTLYRRGQRLGDEGAQQIGRYRDEIVEPLPPVSLPDGDGHDYDVRRLRVAEYAAPQYIGIRPHHPRTGHQQQVDGLALTCQVSGRCRFFLHRSHLDMSGYRRGIV